MGGCWFIFSRFLTFSWDFTHFGAIRSCKIRQILGKLQLVCIRFLKETLDLHQHRTKIRVTTYTHAKSWPRAHARDNMRGGGPLHNARDRRAALWACRYAPLCESFGRCAAPRGEARRIARSFGLRADTRPHILKGVYEVNHLAGVHVLSHAHARKSTLCHDTSTQGHRTEV